MAFPEALEWFGITTMGIRAMIIAELQHGEGVAPPPPKMHWLSTWRSNFWVDTLYTTPGYP